jgi:hypothetical protein
MVAPERDRFTRNRFRFKKDRVRFAELIDGFYCIDDQAWLPLDWQRDSKACLICGRRYITLDHRSMPKVCSRECWYARRAAQMAEKRQAA